MRYGRRLTPSERELFGRIQEEMPESPHDGSVFERGNASQKILDAVGKQLNGYSINLKEIWLRQFIHFLKDGLLSSI